jgi:hypothetical protein
MRAFGFTRVTTGLVDSATAKKQNMKCDENYVQNSGRESGKQERTWFEVVSEVKDHDGRFLVEALALFENYQELTAALGKLNIQNWGLELEHK